MITLVSVFRRSIDTVLTKSKKKKFKVKRRKLYAVGEKVNDLGVKGLNSESNDYIVRVVRVFWTNNREN